MADTQCQSLSNKLPLACSLFLFLFLFMCYISTMTKADRKRKPARTVLGLFEGRHHELPRAAQRPSSLPSAGRGITIQSCARFLGNLLGHCAARDEPMSSRTVRVGLRLRSSLGLGRNVKVGAVVLLLCVCVCWWFWGEAIF